MILKVFAVRDMKAEAFLQPFFSPSVGSALRAFQDAVNDKSCPFNKHPGDYVLYEIGTYDDNLGRLEALSVLRWLANAGDLAEMNPKFGDMPGDIVAANKVAVELQKAEVDGKK